MRRLIFVVFFIQVVLVGTVFSQEIKEVRSIKLAGVNAGAMFALDNESVLIWDNLGNDTGSCIVNIQNGENKKIPELKFVETTDRKNGYLISLENPSDSKSQRIKVVQLVSKKNGSSQIIRLIRVSRGQYSFVRYTLPELGEDTLDSGVLKDPDKKIYIHYPSVEPYGYILGNNIFFCTIGNGTSQIFTFMVDENGKINELKSIESDVPYLKPITETLFAGAVFQRYLNEKDENSSGEWMLVVADPEKKVVKKSSIKMIGVEAGYLNNVFITMPDRRTVVYIKRIMPYTGDKFVGEIELGIAELSR